MSVLSELSVLIVTWKGDDLLCKCLESLHQACGDGLEIVVVDNASCASTKRLVSKFANVRYVATGENRGFAGGNNIGLPFCSREYVLLLNNDTVVHEEPFSQMIRYMQDHPQVAVTQGTMNLPNMGNSLDMCGALITPVGLLHERMSGLPTLSTKRSTRPVLVAKGAMLLFRREIISRVGGFLFYDHFRSNYEESDFCYRVWLSGFEVHYVDTKPIDHLRGATISRFDQEEVLSQSFSNNLFSLMANLDGNSLIKVLGLFLVFHFSVFLYSAVLFRGATVRFYLRSIMKTWRRRKELVVARHSVQKCRRVSDRQIFSSVMIFPDWRYFLSVAKGKPCDVARW